MSDKSKSSTKKLTTKQPVKTSVNKKREPKKKIVANINVEPEQQLTSADIANMAEPLPKDPSEIETRGRKSTKQFASYDEAKDFMKDQMVSSRSQYDHWWKRHQPKDIPRFPYRVYKEWVSWNDFLGTANKFGRQNNTKHRTFEDAIRYVHSLKLNTFAEWKELVKNNQLPADIPKRPDLVYSKWRTWPYWLGTTIRDTLEAKQQVAKSQIYYIIHETGSYENVLTFGIDSGISSFYDRWERDNFKIIRVYWYNPNHANYINAVVTKLSSPYLGDDYRRIVPNFWEIIYYLEQKLDRANLQQARQTIEEMRRYNPMLLTPDMKGASDVIEDEDDS